jgi:hypothetical protein
VALLRLLFGDDTRIGVLRLLRDHPEGLTQRRLAERLGRAPSHINKVVQSFEAIGLTSMDRGRGVRLDPSSPLYDAVMETLQRFDRLNGIGAYLRTAIRAANDRFRDRYYVGGYVAATRVPQPIDFASDRLDLYVKRIAPADDTWLKGLRQLTPYDIRLHPIEAIKGYVEENATIDDEPCLVAYPEVGAMQCLIDETFPRYGALLLLVQGLDEWARGEEGYQPQQLETIAQGSRWEGPHIRRLIDFIEGRHPDPPEILTAKERKELQNAIETVRTS